MVRELPTITKIIQLRKQKITLKLKLTFLLGGMEPRSFLYTEKNKFNFKKEN